MSNSPEANDFDALEREWRARAAPRTDRLVALVVRLPRADRRASSRRALPERAALTIEGGLDGDRWAIERREDLAASPDLALHGGAADRQLTVMELRAIECISTHDLFGHLALEVPGDNLVVDFDLSTANLPIGARFSVGDATLEVTAPPHLGCKKFEARYGPAALAWVNSPSGRERRLRGLNARVITPGVVALGARVSRLTPPR